LTEPISSELSPLRVAVLLSGGGRTLDNFLRWRGQGRLLAEVVCVASNKVGVRGLVVAADHAIAHQSFRLSSFDGRPARDLVLWEWVRSFKPDLVLLAGYLAKLDLDASGGLPVLNIHPSLLPRHGGEGYYGSRVHAAVLEAKDKTTGCTVHLVDHEFDRGRIVGQRSVEVLAGDDVDRLAARVFAAECELYPQIVNAVARGEVSLQG
jgi:phosphoribosylglycinamide formyltransferase 1